MADPKPHAIVFPYPYQGHVTPMINLSTTLASKGFAVTFVQTQFIHHSISRSNTAGDDDADVDIFAQARNSGLDIRYVTISDGFPLEFDRDLNYDLYWETMFRDFPERVDEVVARTIGADHASSSFFLIADTFYSWPSTIAKKYNLLNVSLWTEPAIVFSINYHMDLLRRNGHFPYTGDDCVIDYIPGVESIRTRDLMSYIQDPDMIPTLFQVVVKGFEQVKEADFVLCNTVEELEFETLSAQSHNIPTYAIGPINFYTDSTNTNIIPSSLFSEYDCTHWLNTKPPGSVLYVSFGSIAQSNKQDTIELAQGLLLSRVHFVWIIRPEFTGENGSDRIFPAGFEDAIKDRGLIVPWCNQNRLLSNAATGGFLTHCGWNSILESIWHGVPMICHPFLVDQPTNRKLVVDDWKTGINLCEGEQVTRDEVANKIDFLMSGENSDEMKLEIKRVGRKLHDSLGSGGSSRRNINRFVEDLKAKLIQRELGVINS